MDSRKYGRTYHYEFSPGTTSDDRINWEWYQDLQQIDEAIDTEKMDGENTCMNYRGLFARSHAAPTRHPWSEHLKPKYAQIKQDLIDNDIELFGENVYAIHSIIYPNIESHFYLFAVRSKDMWLSWEEVKEWAYLFDFPVVPDFGTFKPKGMTEEEITKRVIDECNKPSVFGSIQNGTNKECTKEGVVTRNVKEYPVKNFKQNVFKYVRKDHVSTDVHWSKNWKRADLKWEREAKKNK